MEKDSFNEQLHSRKLVIRGAGTIARKFYELYGHMLEISYCTTNQADECLDGLTRIELEQILREKDKYFIIVCVGDYESVSFELISEGLMPIENFASSGLVAGVIEKKKIFLAVGQCELSVTNFIYINMPCINKTYLTLYYDEYKVLGIAGKLPILQSVLEVNEIIDMADYFIYPINLTSRGNYYDRLLLKVNPKCCTVGVPLATFEGYWPQDNVKDYYEQSPYYLTLNIRLRRDINIENSFANHIENDVLNQISRDDFYDEVTLNKCFNRTIKKFQILERKSDVIISDYYQENYKKQKLFLDRGHASDFVLKEYARRILEKCNIDFKLEELKKVDLNWYIESHNEFPIYPSVRKYLGWTEDDKYLYNNGEKTVCLNFKEYIEIIYNYIKKGREYIGEC
jgi:hypothetical protein